MMPQPMPTVHFQADRGDAGRRLDHAIVRRVHNVARLTRNRAQEWISSGAVTVDGRVVIRAAARLREGARVDILLPDSSRLRAEPAPELWNLDVLFEDDALLAVNKPPGVVVHPSYKNASGTLLNAVLGRRQGAGRMSGVGIVTRLDKDTSGVVLIALEATCHHQVQRDAARRLVRKEYLAIVDRVPRSHRGVIQLPLARDPQDRRRVVVARTGAESETRYEVVKSAGGRALLRCELVTGRTHQIRVHLAASGWPIAGDPVYGTAHRTLARQALHAWRVSLPHPVTHAPLTITAPVPEDIATTFGELLTPDS
jgi:23S rRNA pseudouridine1911/1915/1917 synthase